MARGRVRVRRRKTMRPKTSIAKVSGPLMYTIELSLGTVEELERGRCPESLANYAHELLAWRREAIRATAPAPHHRKG
jgi:hypothetical protein